MAGREGFACPNPSCNCKACTCGDGCTCGVSAEVTCDPCKDFKAAAAMAKGKLLAQLSSPLEGKPVVLTPETVVGYVAALGLPQFTGGQALTAADSSTGNLNYCFVVAAEGGGPSVFVKQAPDFVRCLGEDAKLTTDRCGALPCARQWPRARLSINVRWPVMGTHAATDALTAGLRALFSHRIRTEIAAAMEFTQHAPGCLPQIYNFDGASCVCVSPPSPPPKTKRRKKSQCLRCEGSGNSRQRHCLDPRHLEIIVNNAVHSLRPLLSALAVGEAVILLTLSLHRY